MSLKPFSGNISFNAQHSPTGAFMSFTCGHFDTRGGIGVQIGKPANQDLYIGIKDGDRFADVPLKCLPFFQSARSGGAGAADFQVEQAGPVEQQATPNVIAYSKEQVERRYGWATDEWKTNDFTFTIYTPFGTIPDPAVADHKSLANALRPAVIAELTIDNTNGTATKTAFFAMNFNEPGWRPLAIPQTGPRRGFALRREIGVIAEVAEHADESPTLFCRWTPDEGLRQRTPHLLGSCPGMLLEVAPGKKRTLRLTLGCHLPNIVTTGLEGRYFYNRYFASLEHVLTDALDQGDPLPRANELDNELLTSGLSDDQQFLIAHATRSYYGSTQLLDVGGEPFWIVNEGEYCMMNTLDLSVDQVFWELKHNPWVVRNLLDNFVRHYSYVDQVKLGKRDPTNHGDQSHMRFDSAQRAEGGISFTHDMGAHNNFSPRGQSSYELPDLTGCFSFMTHEQLCNWVLIASSYVAATDDTAWAKANKRLIAACHSSLVNRRDNGEGRWMRYDSALCQSGAEITTYDSLDESLGQARDNLYLAVKRWAAFAGIYLIDFHCGLNDVGHYAGNEVEHFPVLIHKLASTKSILPAIFDATSPGHESRILAACEGLCYPLFWKSQMGWNIYKGIGESVWLADALSVHTRELLLDPARRNLFPDGGIKFSSTSNNSWMSKIALFQHVAREVFHLDEDPAIKDLFAKADAAHVKWQTDGSGYWACSDQFVNGIAKGSRYYPRIITTALWMEGKRTGSRQ